MDALLWKYHSFHGLFVISWLLPHAIFNCLFIKCLVNNLFDVKRLFDIFDVKKKLFDKFDLSEKRVTGDDNILSLNQPISLA